MRLVNIQQVTVRQLAETDDGTTRFHVNCVVQNRGYESVSNLHKTSIASTMWSCHADVAELADAIDLGSIALTGVEVRVLSSALIKIYGPVV